MERVLDRAPLSRRRRWPNRWRRTGWSGGGPTPGSSATARDGSWSRSAGSGANVIPVRGARPGRERAFADLAAINPRQCSSIVGPADAGARLLGAPRTGVGDRPARCAPCQPLLAVDTPPAVPADPAVRLVRPDEINALFPAAVAMYTEEVGVSPLADRGEHRYRATDRRSGTCGGGRTRASSTAGSCSRPSWPSSPSTPLRCRASGSHPAYRGRGLAVTGMAAVVRDALRRVAPTVSLYVNDFNAAGPPGVRADPVSARSARSRPFCSDARASRSRSPGRKRLTLDRRRIN